MTRYEILITGLSPLLQHRFPMNPDEAPDTGKAKSKNATPEQVAEFYIHKDGDGKIIEPAEHLRASIKAGAAGMKIKGRGQATYTGIIGAGAIMIEEAQIPLIHSGWIVDSRAVVIKTGIKKARLIRHRACFMTWALRFTLNVDDHEVPEDVVRAALDKAGRYVGIGDFRPQNGGPFGRFRVDEFKKL